MKKYVVAFLRSLQKTSSLMRALFQTSHYSLCSLTNCSPTFVRLSNTR
jgi:hypothetical protein